MAIKMPTASNFINYMKAETYHDIYLMFVFDKISIYLYILAMFQDHLEAMLMLFCFPKNKFETTKIRHFTDVGQNQYPFTCIKIFN